MKHVHKYETITHIGLSEDAKALGIREAEKRKCALCNKETIFILIKGNKLVSLSKEDDADETDILLA